MGNFQKGGAQSKAEVSAIFLFVAFLLEAGSHLAKADLQLPKYK